MAGARTLALLVTYALALVTACGSRTALDVPHTGPASSPGLDAGPPPSCVAGKAPGEVAWTATLPGHEMFVGPLSTDVAGTTYFVGTVGKYPTSYDLVALDACGQVLWAAPGTPTVYGNGTAGPAVIATGDRVLVQWGAVDSFDRATGSHRWNVSLDALAGEKLAGDDFGEIAPIVASESGTAFVLFETSGTATIAAIDPSGGTTAVATTPNDGDLSGFILDGAGNLDILFNSALDGAYVESFTLAGAKVFEAAFSCTPGFLAPLASGIDFIAMQTGPLLAESERRKGGGPNRNEEEEGRQAAKV